MNGTFYLDLLPVLPFLVVVWLSDCGFALLYRGGMPVTFGFGTQGDLRVDWLYGRIVRSWPLRLQRNAKSLMVAAVFVPAGVYLATVVQSNVVQSNVSGHVMRTRAVKC